MDSTSSVRFKMPPLFDNIGRQPSDKQDFAVLISQLYTSGKYSDLVIKCEDRKFNVHRAIVCTQSRPIAAAIDHGFKEASTGEIHLEEDDPEIVELMINFLYNGNYVLPNNLSTKSGNEASSQDSVRLGTPASGNTTPRSPLFGNVNTTTAQQTTAAPPQGSLFGAAPASTAAASTATAGGLFSIAPTGTGGLFAARAPTSPTISGPFGLSTVTATPVAPNAFTNLAPPPGFNLQTTWPATANPPYGFTFTNTNTNSHEPTTLPTKTKKKKPISIYTAHPELCGEHLVKNAKVYIIAEKYDIQPLKKCAYDKYTNMLDSSWNSTAFVQTIEIIFDGTPDKLETDSIRQASIEAAAKHSKELLDREEFVTLCQERGDIATAILQATHKKAWK